MKKVIYYQADTGEIKFVHIAPPDVVFTAMDGLLIIEVSSSKDHDGMRVVSGSLVPQSAS